jgi:hypothetical protein
MDKVKRNRLYAVSLWQGGYAYNTVTFHRENRGTKQYRLTKASARRLQPHLQNAGVSLGPNWIVVSIYPS